jgi:MSHA biogenesis protein MshN
VEQAVEVLTRALPAVGSDNDYYAFYAALLQRLARHAEASETYRVLVEQQPDNGLWWMGLAISLDAMKEMEDALYSYNRALEGQSLNQELRDYVLQQIARLSG